MIARRSAWAKAGQAAALAFILGCGTRISMEPLPPGDFGGTSGGPQPRLPPSFDASSPSPNPFDASANSGPCGARCPSGEYCYENQPAPVDPTDGAAPDAVADAAADASDASDAGSSDAQVQWDGAVYPSGCHPIGADCLATPTCSCILGDLATACAARPPTCSEPDGGLVVVCISGGGL